MRKVRVELTQRLLRWMFLKVLSVSGVTFITLGQLSEPTELFPQFYGERSKLPLHFTHFRLLSPSEFRIGCFLTYSKSTFLAVTLPLLICFSIESQQRLTKAIFYVIPWNNVSLLLLLKIKQCKKSTKKSCFWKRNQKRLTKIIYVYSVMSSHFCTSNALSSLLSAKLTLRIRSSSINLSHFRLY